MWTPFQQIDFSKEEIKSYHIDTRDFHCSQVEGNYDINFDLDTLKNNKFNKFFHTPEEVIALLNRYYAESGGEGEWRMFNLNGPKIGINWALKYIRIYRTEYGLLVCNNDNYALNKEILDYPVDQEHLNHY